MTTKKYPTIAFLAMIPVDNSQAGCVADVHDLIPNGNLYIDINNSFRDIVQQRLSKVPQPVDQLEGWTSQ